MTESDSKKPEAAVEGPWEIQLKGAFGREGGGHELSVIRKDDRHGHLSWGWGGPSKIILFSSGTGGNMLGANDQALAMDCARILCDGLNRRDA
jgi:hypothetical protein